MKTTWYTWPLEHYRISLLIVGLLFILGIIGMYVMPKDEFPHVVIRQGVVVAVYPGASTEEVEQQVARPLERYLFTFEEVNRAKTTTTSQNGLCIMMVELNGNVNNNQGGNSSPMSGNVNGNVFNPNNQNQGGNKNRKNKNKNRNKQQY